MKRKRRTHSAEFKARIDALPRWLDAANPDVVLLQEIKSIDENFPRAHFEDKGYIERAKGHSRGMHLKELPLVSPPTIPLAGKTLQQLQSYRQFLRAWVSFHGHTSFYQF